MNDGIEKNQKNQKNHFESPKIEKITDDIGKTKNDILGDINESYISGKCEEYKFQSNSIPFLRKNIDEFVKERDWKPYHTPKSLAIALSLDASELLEHFLFKPDSHTPENMEDFKDEMADIFIYLMSLANTLNISDFGKLILRKIEKNKKKYPKEQFSGDKYTKQ